MPSSWRSYFPLLLITILLIFGYQSHWLGALTGLNRAQEAACYLLVGTAYLWISEVIPLYVTSLLVLLLSLQWLLPLIDAQGGNASDSLFYLAFFGDITLLFLGGFVLSMLLNKYGLATRLADWMLRRTGDKPTRVLMGVIAISAVLSMWMSNTATAAMMFAIMTPIIQELPASTRFGHGISLAIPFACNLGGLGTPIGTPPNAIALDYLNKNGFSLGFGDWMVLSIPIMVLLLILLWTLLLYLFPPGDLRLPLKAKKKDALTKRQLAVVVIFLVAVLGWLTSGFTGLSSGTIGLIIVLVAFGGRFLGTRDFRSISWDILFMLGGGLCLGVGLKESGLTATLAAALPFDQGFTILFLLLLVVAATMTSFMSNTATANLLIPIAISLPQNPLLFAVTIALMCSASMVMPVSTPPNAIAFGSGLLKAKDMVRSGLLITILALICTFLAGAYYFPLFSFT